jgi:hypothetical protein
MKNKRVTLNMRRVVSEAREPERTKAHPANGTYSIQEIRDAKPEEEWF